MMINGKKGSGTNITDNMQDVTNTLSKVMTTVGGVVSTGNNLNTPYLHPYSYLYATKETGKYFVFPIINDSSFSASNRWGDDSDNNGQGFLTKLITSNLGWLPTLAVAGRTTIDEMSNLIDIFKSDAAKIAR